MQVDSNEAKAITLRRISGRYSYTSAGNAKYRIGSWLVHTRYCGKDQSAPEKYKFNINPNTLSAHFELWVCGLPATYYLIPTALMNEIYHHPEAYIDKLHPKIRIVSVDLSEHRLTYARGGTSIDLSKYFGSTLQ